MTEYNRIFFDTAPIIYYLDKDKTFGNAAKNVLQE